MATGISLVVPGFEIGTAGPAKTNGVDKQAPGASPDFAALVEMLDLSVGAGSAPDQEPEAPSGDRGGSTKGEAGVDAGGLPLVGMWLHLDELPAAGGQGRPPEDEHASAESAGRKAGDARARDAMGAPKPTVDAAGPTTVPPSHVVLGLVPPGAVSAPEHALPEVGVGSDQRSEDPAASEAPRGSQREAATSARPPAAGPPVGAVSDQGLPDARPEARRPLMVMQGRDVAEPPAAEGRVPAVVPSEPRRVPVADAAPDVSQATVATKPQPPAAGLQPRPPVDDARAAATAELARALSVQKAGTGPGVDAPLAGEDPAPRLDKQASRSRGLEMPQPVDAARASSMPAAMPTGGDTPDLRGRGQPSSYGDLFGARSTTVRPAVMNATPFASAAGPFTVPDLPAPGIRAAGAAPAGSLAPDAPDFPQQVVRSVQMQWRQGIGEARLQLQPAHLGHVTVTVRVEDGHVTDVLRTESQRALERIEAHQHELRSALEQQGLRLDRIVVAADPDGRGRRQPSEAPLAKRRDTGRGERQTLFTLDGQPPA